MEVTGNTIRATVSTDLLRDDIIQHQKELISLLRDISGLDGTVVFDIEVKEDRAQSAPSSRKTSSPTCAARTPRSTNFGGNSNWNSNNPVHRAGRSAVLSPESPATAIPRSSGMYDRAEDTGRSRKNDSIPCGIAKRRTHRP